MKTLVLFLLMSSAVFAQVPETEPVTLVPPPAPAPAEQPKAVLDPAELYRPRGLPAVKKLWFVDLKLNTDGVPLVALGWKAPEEWFLGAEITGVHKAFTDKTDPSIPHDYRFDLGGTQARLAVMKEFLPFRQKKITFGAGAAVGHEWLHVKYDFSNVVSGTTVDRGSDSQGLEGNFAVVMSDFRYTPDHTFLDTPLSWIFGVEARAWSDHDSYDVHLPDGSTRPKELWPQTSVYAWAGAAFYF